MKSENIHSVSIRVLVHALFSGNGEDSIFLYSHFLKNCCSNVLREFYFIVFTIYYQKF